MCLWEICTGLLPTRGRMRALVSPADCPPEVAELVAACMQPDPAQRPPAAEVAALLEAAAPGTPPQARASPAQQPRQASRLGRSVSSAALARVAARPPRPRSEASLQVGQRGSLLPALEQAGRAPAAAPAPQQRWQQPAGSSPSHPPRAASPALLAERASSDSVVGRVAPLAPALAVRPLECGLSLPVPQHPSEFTDPFGLGLF